MRVEALKNDAEKAAGVASEAASNLADDVKACEAQIEVNKQQTVEDKAYLLKRSNELDALVSGAHRVRQLLDDLELEAARRVRR